MRSDRLLQKLVHHASSFAGREAFRDAMPVDLGQRKLGRIVAAASFSAPGIGRQCLALVATQ